MTTPSNRIIAEQDTCPVCESACLVTLETHFMRYRLTVKFESTTPPVTPGKPLVFYDTYTEYPSEEVLDVIDSRVSCFNGCNDSQINAALSARASYLQTLEEAVS